MRWQFLAFPLFASLIASPFACAQNPVLYASSRTESEINTIHRTVGEVQLRFVVTDKKHQPVTDLQRNQISVFDSGSPAGPVVDFRKDTDLPLHVLVLIDGSESVDKASASEQAIAVQLAQHFLRPGLDTARVAAFDGSLEPVVLLTADGGGVKKALSAVRDGNLTALYDALVQSSRTFAENSGMARRVIILLSDGEDNYSLHGLSEAIEAVQKADATIYAVNVGSSARGGNVMLELAGQTGGRMFAVPKPKQLERVFAQIEEELRCQYSVAFRPTERDGRFHPVRVHVTGSGPVTVQARSGYWAPNE